MFTKITYLKNTILYVEAEGRLDIQNAPDYLDEIKENLSMRYTQELILDFSKINFVASIGLRTILELYKIMQRKNGLVKLKNVNKEVLYSFKITGFDKFLIIENDSDNPDENESYEQQTTLKKADDIKQQEEDDNNFVNNLVKTELNEIIEELNKWHYYTASIMGCNNSIKSIKSNIIKTLLLNDRQFNETIEIYEKISKNEFVNEWTNQHISFNKEIQQIFGALIPKLKEIRKKIKNIN